MINRLGKPFFDASSCFVSLEFWNSSYFTYFEKAKCLSFIITLIPLPFKEKKNVEWTISS
jgi:hypothetical protein